MFILAAGGQTYSRLGLHVGPGGSLELPVTVDYSLPFGAADHDAWANEYDANVRIEQSPLGLELRDVLEPADWGALGLGTEGEWLDDWSACDEDEPDPTNCGGFLHA
jgi:hypothetical protein